MSGPQIERGLILLFFWLPLAYEGVTILLAKCWPDTFHSLCMSLHTAEIMRIFGG